MATHAPLTLSGNRVLRLPTGDTIDPAYLPASGGGGGLSWSTVTASTAIAAGQGYVVNDAATQSITLPVSVAAGDVFAVHAKGAAHRIVSNGNVIDAVGSGNDLMVSDGDTAMLVAYAAGLLRIV